MTRTVSVFLALALVASAAAAPVQFKPAQIAPRPAAVAGQPVQIKCPAKVSIDVTPPYVPAGWNSTGQSAVFKSAEIREWQGQQDLRCNYGIPGNDFAASLRHQVPRDSCVYGPDHAWFQCKAGTN